MAKHVTFARRRFTWVQEQPGPILILFIVLSFGLTAHFVGSSSTSQADDAPSASTAP